MTHDELLIKIDNFEPDDELDSVKSMNALRAVVELHRQDVRNQCDLCTWMTNGGAVMYPCLTIQTIEKELS